MNVINSILDAIPEKESILFIGRYNKDVRVLPTSSITYDDDGKKASISYRGREMRFMSIHASKGLEADNIIVLNCSADKSAFPSRVADDPILGYVLSEVDDFPFSEERRLFYVGITRAKKHTYVLYNENAPSSFVVEMEGLTSKTANNKQNYICPCCGNGALSLKTKMRSRFNNFEFRVYRCSNRAANCNFKMVLTDVRDDDHAYSLYNRLFARQLQRVQNHTYHEPSPTPVLWNSFRTVGRMPFIPPVPQPRIVPPTPQINPLQNN